MYSPVLDRESSLRPSYWTHTIQIHSPWLHDPYLHHLNPWAQNRYGFTAHAETGPWNFLSSPSPARLVSFLTVSSHTRLWNNHSETNIRHNCLADGLSYYWLVLVSKFTPFLKSICCRPSHYLRCSRRFVSFSLLLRRLVRIPLDPALLLFGSSYILSFHRPKQL